MKKNFITELALIYYDLQGKKYNVEKKSQREASRVRFTLALQNKRLDREIFKEAKKKYLENIAAELDKIEKEI